VRTPALRPLAAVLALGALALAACGSGDDEDVQKLLDKAFTSNIPSADLRLDAELKLEGSEALRRPIRIQAKGPFRNNKGKLPSSDLDVDIGTGGAQSIRIGVLTTGERAFVEFQDVFYEQPRSAVEQANQSLRRGDRRGSSLERLGLDPRSWLKEAEDDGDEEVAGVETRHVSGRLDVERLVRDLNEFVKRSASLGSSAAGPPPPPLSNEDVEKIAEAVKDPSFDVYVGKEDNVIRRLSGRIEVEVPEEDRDRVGLDGGTLAFTLEFSDVGGDQRIEAPAKSRPISDLAGSLGPGALGGLGGGGGSSNGGSAPTPPAGGGAADPEAFQRYADCLDKARPEDTDALQRCAELLE
jgi:hypothetical protein